MDLVSRDGELGGLAGMIADLIEGNLRAHPDRARLLAGPVMRVGITAQDLDAHVGLLIGEGKVVVGDSLPTDPRVLITTDSETLIDLPRAKLLGGLPSIADPVGRATTAKLLTGKLKIKGLARLGLVTRVNRLLSVV